MFVFLNDRIMGRKSVNLRSVGNAFAIKLDLEAAPFCKNRILKLFRRLSKECEFRHLSPHYFSIGYAMSGAYVSRRGNIEDEFSNIDEDRHPFQAILLLGKFSTDVQGEPYWEDSVYIDYTCPNSLKDYKVSDSPCELSIVASSRFDEVNAIEERSKVLLQHVSDCVSIESGIGLRQQSLLEGVYALTGGSVYPAGAAGHGVEINQPTQRNTRIKKWNDVKRGGNPAHFGLLPGVFRWNILTPTQFNSKIHNQVMKRWILSAPNRGTIEEIGVNHLKESVLVWTVEAEQESSLERDLADANRLVDRQWNKRLWYKRGYRWGNIWQEPPHERYGRLVDDVAEGLVKTGAYDPHFVMVRRPLSEMLDWKTEQPIAEDERACDIMIAGGDRKLYLIEVAFASILPVTAERKLRSMAMALPADRLGAIRVIDYEEAKQIAGWPPGEPQGSGHAS